MVFFYGVEVIEIDVGFCLIQMVKFLVIGIVGIVFDVDVDVFFFNMFVVVVGFWKEVVGFDIVGDSNGIFLSVMDGIFDQIGVVVIVVCVDEGVDEVGIFVNVIGGVNVVDGNFEGVYVFVGVESVVGYVFCILIVSGFIYQCFSGFVNLVVVELQGIVNCFCVVVIVDGLNIIDIDVYIVVGDFGFDCIYLCDFWYKVIVGSDIFDLLLLLCVVGLIVKVDNNIGFWVLFFNNLIFGIIGIICLVDFKFGDVSVCVNFFNENKVVIIICQNGFCFWGNWMLIVDIKWLFLSVCCIVDIINDLFL